MSSFTGSFAAEWLKKKRSAASWLTVTGALLIPLLMIIASFVRIPAASEEVLRPDFWHLLHYRHWQFMAFLLLPMGVILATSLIGQIEFRNNSWKQLHATPQNLVTIYFAKLLVIIVMLLEFFILFNVGIFLAGYIPSLLSSSIDMPVEPFPLKKIIESSALFFVDCMPILALQFVLSIMFRNFLIPLGAGLALLVASLIALSWQYGHFVPYIYCALNFAGDGARAGHDVNIHIIAGIYTAVFMIAGLIFYITKRNKG